MTRSRGRPSTGDRSLGKTHGGPWRRTAPGPEGTATPSADPAAAPAFCLRTPDRTAGGDAGIAVARPETTSLSMSCGTRAQDFRPGDPDGARFLRSFPHCWYCSLPTAGDATCSATCHSATLRQPAPLPVLHLLWLGTPLPNLPVRAPAADAFTEVLLTGTAGELRYYVVLLAAAPDHCGPPGLVVSPVAVLQQPWLRDSTTTPPCNCGTAPRQFVSAGLCWLSGLREKP